VEVYDHGLKVEVTLNSTIALASYDLTIWSGAQSSAVHYPGNETARIEVVADVDPFKILGTDVVDVSYAIRKGSKRVAFTNPDLKYTVAGTSELDTTDLYFVDASVDAGLFILPDLSTITPSKEKRYRITVIKSDYSTNAVIIQPLPDSFEQGYPSVYLNVRGEKAVITSFYNADDDTTGWIVENGPDIYLHAYITTPIASASFAAPLAVPFEVVGREDNEDVLALPGPPNADIELKHPSVVEYSYNIDILSTAGAFGSFTIDAWLELDAVLVPDSLEQDEEDDGDGTTVTHSGVFSKNTAATQILNLVIQQTSLVGLATSASITLKIRY
jgi:hypothetical protein